MYLLTDTDRQNIYGVFEDIVAAKCALRLIANTELKHYLSIDGDLRADYFAFYAEPDTKEIDPNSASYQEMLKEWKKGFEIQKLPPINITQLPKYVKENE